MIELPADLAADLVPLAWLLGSWEGTGVIDYHTGDYRYTGEFAHRVTFARAGDALAYTASATFLTPEGADAGELLSESGFWRLQRPHGDTDAGPGLLPPRAPAAPRTADDVELLRTSTNGFRLAVSIAHSDGSVELYDGQSTGARIDLATVGRLAADGTKQYASAERMYGLVQGHLLWAWDIAALDSDLASHASARLAKVVDETEAT